MTSQKMKSCARNAPEDCRSRHRETLVLTSNSSPLTIRPIRPIRPQPRWRQVAVAFAPSLAGWCSRALLDPPAADLAVAERGLRPTQWTLDYEGKTLLVYAFDPQRFKPYVKVLNTL